MCYNSKISFTFAIIGLISLAYIYTYKKQLTYTGIQYILLTIMMMVLNF